MTPAEAAKLIELPADATPEQMEARFLDLRRKLEDKIAKAPTPGLQAKYRESLTEITAAFETLTLAADSSALPVLKKEAGDRRPETGAAATPPRGLDSGLPPAKRTKSGGMEFAIVAIIAVAVLAGGGWWVLKTRAENAEKARIAAEVQAAAEAKAAAEKAEAERRAAEEKRLAEEARLAAEAKRQAEEVEKARVAAAEKAEQERRDRLTTQLRSELAAAKVAWEALEREEQVAERRLSELRSDQRNLRDAPAGRVAEIEARVNAQQAYHEWLGSTLVRHPAKVFRSRAEELLSGRQPDLAQEAVTELKAALSALEAEVPARSSALLDLEGELVLETGEDVTWSLTDAFGRSRQGRGPGRIDGVAVGRGQIVLSKPSWPKRTETVHVQRAEPAKLAAPFVGVPATLTSVPSGAEVWDEQGTAKLGVTPLKLDLVPEVKSAFEFRLAGHLSVLKRHTAEQGKSADIAVELPKAEEYAAASCGALFLPFNTGAYHITTIRPGSSAEASGALKIGDQLLAFGVPGQPLTELTGLPVEKLLTLGTNVVGASEVFRILRPGETVPREIELPTQYSPPEHTRELLALIEEIKALVRSAGLNSDMAVAIFSPFQAGETALLPVGYSDVYGLKRLIQANRGKLVAFAQIEVNAAWRIGWPTLAIGASGLAQLQARASVQQITFHGTGAVHLLPSPRNMMSLGESAAIPVSQFWSGLKLSSPFGNALNYPMKVTFRVLP